MKKIYLFAAVAALFAACSSDNLTSGQQAPQAVAANDGSIGFDGYVTRGITRSGTIGTMTPDKLTGTSANVGPGFGVFGYYTDNNEYAGQTIPDFMYNQQVKAHFESSTFKYWEYDPVKYWPNEYGNSAIADDNDKVSFFAYAPYVTVNPASGKAQDQTFGITQLSRNSATGDPYAKYIASFDYKKGVDLMWGVVPTESTAWKIVSGETETLAAGLPWLNVERPLGAQTQDNTDAPNQRVKFQFKHALAQLNVQVDYDADSEDHSDNEIAKGETRIYIRSVSFTGFSMKGALNLNNIEANKPLWKAFDGENEIEAGETTTVNDGRKDGREGVSGAVADNETHRYLNPLFVQDKAFNLEYAGGVQTFPLNLFNTPGADLVKGNVQVDGIPTGKIDLSSNDDYKAVFGTYGSSAYEYKADNNTLLTMPVMVIPNGDEMTVSIVYDVETKSGNLSTTLSDGATNGASIENKITKTITFAGNKNYLEAGKKYIVKLHLGMNSVKFDADVSDWVNATPESEGWLPSNLTTFQAPGTYNYDVPAAATQNPTAFTLTGFLPNENITTNINSVAGTETSSATGEVSIAQNALTAWTANTTVVNNTIPSYASWKGDVSGREVVLNIVQAAAQPSYTATGTPQSELSSWANSGSVATATFTLKDNAPTPNTLTGAVWTGDTRNVQIISATRNGVPMTEVNEGETPTTSTQFRTTTEGGQIEIGSNVANGEVFIFTIKAGDSQPVTIVATVSGIS